MGGTERTATATANRALFGDAVSVLVPLALPTVGEDQDHDPTHEGDETKTLKKYSVELVSDEDEANTD